MLTRKKIFGTLAILALLLLGTLAMGLSLGSVSIPILQGLRPAGLNPDDRTILYQIRLPRVVLAGTVGWSLSIGGVVFQALMPIPWPSLSCWGSPAERPWAPWPGLFWGSSSGGGCR